MNTPLNRTQSAGVSGSICGQHGWARTLVTTHLVLFHEAHPLVLLAEVDLASPPDDEEDDEYHEEQSAHNAGHHRRHLAVEKPRDPSMLHPVTRPYVSISRTPAELSPIHPSPSLTKWRHLLYIQKISGQSGVSGYFLLRSCNDMKSRDETSARCSLV